MFLSFSSYLKSKYVSVVSIITIMTLQMQGHGNDVNIFSNASMGSISLPNSLLAAKVTLETLGWFKEKMQ